MKTDRQALIKIVGLFIALLLLDMAVMLVYKRVELNTVGSAQYYLNVLKQPLLWLGITLSILQLRVWTRILAVTDLSIAYPVSSLSYPLIMMASTLFFHEILPAKVWIGALLITLGVAIIGSRTRH